jgi:arylsulfatase A-like enzyme
MTDDGRAPVKNRRSMSRALRGLRAIATSPPFVGALVVLGLAAWAGQGSDADSAFGGAALGGAAHGGAAFGDAALGGAALGGAALHELTRMKIGMAAAAVALGLVVGLVADVLIRLRYPSSGGGIGGIGGGARARRGALKAFVETALVCFGVHASLVAWSMAESPQLYAARWYAQGGLARTTQVLATDLLGPRGVVLLAIVIAVAYVRPRRLLALVHRAARTVRRPLRAILARVAKHAPASSLTLIFAALVVPSLDAPHTAAAAPAPPPVAPTAPAPLSPATAPAPLSPATAPLLHASTSATAPATALASRRPNILILAADSLRADHLDARFAPNLSLLAARGARFDRAYVSVPRAFPSWVTILTGRHAHHHGIRSSFATWDERARDFDALPQRLARAGYATGVVADHAGDVFGRIDLGLERVDAPSFALDHQLRQSALERETPLLPLLDSQLGRRLFPAMRGLRDAADPMLVADDVATALHAMKGKPFFLAVSFATPGAPYAAPAPYYVKYTDPDYRGRFKYHAAAGPADDAPVDAADVKQLRALYGGAVSAVDDAVGRALRALEREGLADNTIVVVTADHGETLHDNGHGRGHGDHLFGDEGTHVPLVIVDPRIARGSGSGRAGGMARDVDLAPTLYELAGVSPPADLDGRSLVRALRGGELEPRFAYAETELWLTEAIPGLAPELRMPYPAVSELIVRDARHPDDRVVRPETLPLTRMARHRMIRDERWKLVYVPTRKGVRYMLFDTVVDPGETRDVAALKPDEVARLKTELWAWMLADPRMEQKDGFLVPRVTGASP